MTTVKLIRRILGILVAISLIVAGICFIAGCLYIYNSAEASPFSKEIVADTFSKIAIPVYICIALVPVNFIWGIVFPAVEDDKKKIIKDHKAILNRVKRKKDIDLCGEELRKQIQAEIKKRKIASIVTVVIVLVCSIVFLGYGANPSNFTNEGINSSVIAAVKVMAVCFAISCAVAIGYILFTRKSRITEAEMWKKVPNREVSESESTCKIDNVQIARIIIAVLAIAFLVGGFAFGGARDVLTKAANICTECIGLG